MKATTAHWRVSQRVFTLLLGLLLPHVAAFVTRGWIRATERKHNVGSSSVLQMGLDMVTYLRTEWISAALCTNQTPRGANTCLQLGTEDGRIVNFVPRTIREIITSTSAKDGALPIGTKRQLKQQQERRNAATITYSDQASDHLTETEDESVDVVVSLQAAAKMVENGLDWKRSIQEAARVLKPGGRLLFVEQSEIEGESFLDYVRNLMSLSDEYTSKDDAERFPIFDDVGYDAVDLVLVPHTAGVAIKSLDAGLTPLERARKQTDEEKNMMAEKSIEAYERGNKRRRKKMKKTDAS